MGIEGGNFGESMGSTSQESWDGHHSPDSHLSVTPVGSAGIHPYILKRSVDLTDSNRSVRSLNVTLAIKESKESEPGKDEIDGSEVYQPTTELLKQTEKQKATKNKCQCIKFVVDASKGVLISLKGFSRRQFCVLLTLCLATLTSSLSVCLFPPFFPRMAETKGASAAVYGLIIGTNCLTAFIVTPFIGEKLQVVGVRFAFVSGVFVSGGCCFLTGFLEMFPPGLQFIILAIVIRVFHAIANAGVITASIAYIASEFPDSVAFLFSLTRSTMNFAQMFGPVLGGALHVTGGFKMPFFVTGSFQIFVSALCFLLLPSFIANERKSEVKEPKSVLAILKVSGMWVSFITFIFSTMSNGFLSITLEPLVLRKFGLSPLYVGLLFGLKDGANCIASPVWGWFCDKFPKVRMMIVLGTVMALTSFIILGPMPGLPEYYSVWIVVFALVLNGFGIGGQQVAGVVNAIREAVDAGFPDEPDTHGFIAGLWSSLSGAGRFISRAASGVFVDLIGFRNTCAIVIGLHATVFLVTVLFMILHRSQSQSEGKVNGSVGVTVVVSTPSEPVGSKTSEVQIPYGREDLEDSFIFGSHYSRTSRRGSYSKVRRMSDMQK